MVYNLQILEMIISLPIPSAIRFIKKLFLILIFCFCLLPTQLIFANAITDTLTEVGDQTGLTNYEGDVHEDAVDKRGVRNITSAILYLLDFGKYILGSVALIMFVVMGVRMVATTDSESAVTDAKKYFLAAMVGFVLILVADVAVTEIFYGQTGEVLQSQESAQSFAIRGSQEIKGIYTLIEMFLGVIATLTIIISGISMMVSTDDTSAQKKHIMMAVIGLILVGLSEVLVKDFIFDEAGSEINIATGKSIMASLSNFALSFIAVISVAAFIYGGYIYVVSYILGEQNENAKKAIIGALVGILIAAGAYAITQTLIKFEDPADTAYVELRV